MKYNDLRAFFTRRFNIPKEALVRKAIRRFTIAERLVFYFFVGLFVFSGILLLWRVNSAFLIKEPLRGGTMTEGVVGNPRFINPVIALSEADKTLTSLVYSGLLRFDTQGNLVNDLADSIVVSTDGLTYTVHIRPDAKFHDGTPVTADDVVFTIQKIQDPAVKSPLFGDWNGIGISASDDHTVVFTLKAPYSPFENNLTIGILPKHIWSSVSDDEFSFSQYNTLPVGSGIYKIESVQRDSGGIPNYYELTPFSEDGSPYIAHLVFKFYPSESDLLNAYNSGDIQSLSGITPSDAVALKKNGADVLSTPLPRIFAVFFNQNQSQLLLDKSVRQALDLAAPKEDIVNNVLDGYGIVVNGPLPPTVLPEENDSNLPPYATRVTQAKQLLAKDGWIFATSTGVLEKKSKSGTLTLSFTLSTSDSPELKAAAAMLKAAWANIGAEVQVQIYDAGDLNQSVIRPRHYDALLFGEVVGREADVYPFWHSSERNDPGLNIALYANSKVDKDLENARSTTSESKREADLKDFVDEVGNDVPAVFLYSPSFIYVAPMSVHGLSLGVLSAPEDRFLGLRNWYIETDNVWKLFVKNQS